MGFEIPSVKQVIKEIRENPENPLVPRIPNSAPKIVAVIAEQKFEEGCSQQPFRDQRWVKEALANGTVTEAQCVAQEKLQQEIWRLDKESRLEMHNKGSCSPKTCETCLARKARFTSAKVETHRAITPKTSEEWRMYRRTHPDTRKYAQRPGKAAYMRQYRARKKNIYISIPLVV